MRQQRLLIVLLAVVASGALITLAASLAMREEAGPPSERADLGGIVTSVTPNGAFGSLLVEELPGQQTGAKAWLTVTGKTRIFTANGRASKAVGFAALHAGQRVDVWTTGPILQSYPEQTGAGTIVIRGG